MHQFNFLRLNYTLYIPLESAIRLWPNNNFIVFKFINARFSTTIIIIIYCQLILIAAGISYRRWCVCDTWWTNSPKSVRSRVLIAGIRGPTKSSSASKGRALTRVWNVEADRRDKPETGPWWQEQVNLAPGRAI